MIIYGILTTILFLILLPFYYIVRAINGKFIYGWKEKLGFFSAPDLGDKVIMYHGVSVGEVIALENLIRKTKEEFPSYKLVVTTGTKTGQEIAHKKLGEFVDYITYFPFDIPFCVRSFLNKVKPSVVCIAETEIWPTFAYICNKKHIPLFTINGRISDSTFNLYRALKPFFNMVFNYYSGIFAQSKDDYEKYLALGSKNLEIMGNLKFDVQKVEKNFELNAEGKRILIAGSTHKGEDEIIFDTFKKLKQEFDDIKLILAPRHLIRVEEVAELAKTTDLPFGFRSKDDKLDINDILILDTLGELGKIYSICHLAFIGGSFNKTGGHNPLEAAVFNKPTLSGPSIHNFKDIYGILVKEGASKVVSTSNELFLAFKVMLSDDIEYEKACQACEIAFKNQQGALQFVIDKLKVIL